VTSRIGLFGGTFDPPHLGHVAVLLSALATERYDLIEVTVAGDPYLKSAGGTVRPALVRLEMARAAFGHLSHVVVSDREIIRQGPSYTIDSVEELFAEGFTDVDLIVGADLTHQLDAWHRATELSRTVTLAVAPRPGETNELPTGWDAFYIPMDPVDLSSTFIREFTGDGLAHYVPEAVIPFLKAFEH
jgi:nicotinate-nucleotide adenylyltransferase